MRAGCRARKVLNQLDTLVRVGFRKAGRWTLTAGKPCFSLEGSGGEVDVLYAFVSDESVLYIGKTSRGVKKRMYGYQQPGRTQHTNIACNGRLMNLLLEERSVDIYVFAEAEPSFHAEPVRNFVCGA